MKPALVLLLSCFALPMVAQDCRAILGPQSPDAASLKQVEDKWNDAFMHGKPEYLECLLSAEYVSISPKGAHDRNWELEHARANKSHPQPIPEIHGMTFEVFGNTGVMRLFKPASDDGKQPAQYMADIFAFQDGAWHAVYSQHTPVQQ